MQERSTYPILSIGFVKAYIIHMRPYLLFVSGVCGLAGMSVIISYPFSISMFLLTFIPYFSGYGFGQALTDCFQIDTDSISSPYRPLTQKIISPGSVAIVSIIGLIAVFSPLVYLNVNNLLLGLLSVAGLLTYTYFKKNFWYLGPFYNGWIVMLIPIGGYLSMGQGGLFTIFNKNLALISIVTLFSYTNFVLIGYLKDISADRATGYKTFPTVFGWDKTIFVGDIFVFICIMVSMFLVKTDNIASIIFFVSASVLAICSQLYGHFTKNKTESNSTFPITSTVRCLILWHLSIVTTFQQSWTIFSIVFYILFEIIFSIRPKKVQI
jgi:geranylgeranylglycerol-phosphate geranylgeranyltransferase